jgi:hypothetical protein
MKPMKQNVEFPSELPARICDKLESDFRSLFDHDRRNQRILKHYMEQIAKRRLDIEAAAQCAAYDIVGKNKHEGDYKRDDQDTASMAKLRATITAETADA